MSEKEMDKNREEYSKEKIHNMAINELNKISEEEISNMNDEELKWCSNQYSVLQFDSLPPESMGDDAVVAVPEPDKFEKELQRRYADPERLK